MDSPTSFENLNSQRVKRGGLGGYTTTKPPPTAQIMVLQQHHHHYHQVSPATTVSEIPTRRSARLQQQQQHEALDPLFAGAKSKKFSSFNDDFTRSSKPIGAAYTYNWVMWKTFGCGTCLRCAAGWFCLFFACCGILFILWLFGVLWICVFISGFCEIRS